MRESVLFHMTGFCLGILLDLIVGDPHRMPHPVRAMGRLISFLENVFLTPLLSDPENERRDAAKERRGVYLWVIVVLAVFAISIGIISIAYYVNRYAGILVEAVLTCYCLAAKSLYAESVAVLCKLKEEDMDGARYALSMIVGRDTKELSEEEVIKGAVETVAENTSDGVVAPLLYAAIGGPVLALVYKAVNTMDSMIGYRNERYEHFGRFAARADDVFNFLPSRISALCMIVGSRLLGLFSKAYDARQALRIWKRDRRKHLSPNSAQTESVCAGALGLLLGGPHLYKGVMVDKPTIGDEQRKPEIADIKRANAMMFATEAVGVCFAMLLLGLLAAGLTG